MQPSIIFYKRNVGKLQFNLAENNLNTDYVGKQNILLKLLLIKT